MRQGNGKDSQGWLMGIKLEVGSRDELVTQRCLMMAAESMAFKAGPTSRHSQ